MALTVVYDPGNSVVDKCGLGVKMISGTIAFDSSYDSGGEALDLSYFFPTKVFIVIIPSVAGYVFQYDYTNKKVLVFWHDYNGGADAPLIEVTAATNLATALADVRFLAFGK